MRGHEAASLPQRQVGGPPSPRPFRADGTPLRCRAKREPAGTVQAVAGMGTCLPPRNDSSGHESESACGFEPPPEALPNHTFRMSSAWQVDTRAIDERL